MFEEPPKEEPSQETLGDSHKRRLDGVFWNWMVSYGFLTNLETINCNIILARINTNEFNFRVRQSGATESCAKCQWTHWCCTRAGESAVVSYWWYITAPIAGLCLIGIYSDSVPTWKSHSWHCLRVASPPSICHLSLVKRGRGSMRRGNTLGISW